MHKKIIDISVGISPDMLIYPGDPKPQVETIFSIEKDGAKVSCISFGSHTGTHIDAPSHIFKDGITVDQVQLNGLVGKALLLDFSTNGELITGSNLKVASRRFEHIPDITIILLKTGNFAYLDKSGAHWITRNGFTTVGVDSMSVDVPSEMMVHEQLLGNGINIVECLDLHEANEGVYGFMCLPLKIIDCDGAPARAVLFLDCFFQE
ncbi:MAG TPA: cyclase family protein [Methanosarcinaceae archaeon]|nr:cyclase family protein [Methanosarcinaceae archaeon]